MDAQRDARLLSWIGILMINDARDQDNSDYMQARIVPNGDDAKICFITINVAHMNRRSGWEPKRDAMAALLNECDSWMGLNYWNN